MPQSSSTQLDRSAAAPTPTAAAIRTSAAAARQAVFISFASRDRTVADRVVAALEARGLACWISSRDIPSGADYQGSIVAALEAAPVMLLLLSRNAVASKEIPKETAIASELNLPIVPALIDNAEITGALRYQATSAQRLDLSGDFDTGLDRLALDLSHRLGTLAQTRLTLRRNALRRRVLIGLAWPLALALVVLGAASVWHFQAELRAMRAGLAAAPAPERPTATAPAIQPPAVQASGAPAAGLAETRVRRFVEGYYAALSGPAGQVGAYLEAALQDPVQLYGRSMPRRVLVAQEAAYMQRWPDRSFVIRPDTLVVTCQPDRTCSATGVIDYTVRGPARHAVSSGAERFDLRTAGGAAPRLASIETTPLERHASTTEGR